MLTVFLLYATFICFAFHYLTGAKSSVSFKYEFRPLKNSKAFFNQIMALHGASGLKEHSLPKYKYFTQIVYKLFQAKKLYGAPIEQPINELKKALSKDIYFERKLSSSLTGGVYQMLVISFTGLLFILMSCSQLQLRFPVKTYGVSLTINFIGIITYYFLYHYLKVLNFKSLESIVKSYYVLRSYLRCQMPVALAIKKANFNEIKESSKDSYLIERMNLQLKNVREVGGLNFDDFDMQIEEVWLLFEFRFESFQKKLAALKLMIMSLFFLSSYLYIIYDFISMIKV